MSEFTEKLLKYGGIAVLGAAAGMLTFWALTGGDDEERPPIIVQGGSVELTIEYPDETKNQSKGAWTPVGNSGKYRHEHDLPGPNRMRNSVFNGVCTGGGWRNGSLRITYTDGTTDWFVNLSVQGNHIEMDPNGQPVKTYSADTSHLTVKAEGVSWIKSVEPLNGAGTSKCTFEQNSKPIIRIEQKQN
jgi:hypothetical protein